MNNDYRVYTSTGEINGQPYTSIGMEVEPTPVTMSQRVLELTRAVKDISVEVKFLGGCAFMLLCIQFALVILVIFK